MMSKIPSPSLGQVFEFMRLMLRLQAVLRVTRPPGREQAENDVEHSYQLAMMAWYLNEVGRRNLDAGRVLRYALVHDLAEAYAGDVTSLDYAGRAAKGAREIAALERIAAELPEFPGLVEYVRQYERQADSEARLVHALDKLMPMLVTYLDDGRAWHELGWSREELLANKDEKTAGDAVVAELWRDLRQLIEQRPELFRRP